LIPFQGQQSQQDPSLAATDVRLGQSPAGPHHRESTDNPYRDVTVVVAVVKIGGAIAPPRLRTDRLAVHRMHVNRSLLKA
jgi:hypothetical protein